jgi:hypothetical protein
LRSALLFALLAGGGVGAVSAAVQFWRVDGLALLLALWLTLLAHAWLLRPWSGASWGRLAPILAIPLAVGLSASTPAPFIAACLLTLSWMRSGLALEQAGPRLDRVAPKLLAELLLCLGAGALIAAQLAAGPVAHGGGFGATLPRAAQLALGVWLFFLLQSLYTLFFEPAPSSPMGQGGDGFEHAKRRAEAILSEPV